MDSAKKANRMLDKSLAEQMKLTDREIAYRKHLFGLTEDDEMLLMQSRQVFAPQINRIVGCFYEHQTSEPEIALLIGDRDSLERLRSSMRSYILDLFSGRYDAEYVNKRLRIGLIHKRIGVSPKLFMSGMRALHCSLLKECRSFQAEGLGFVDETMEALQKLLFFDSHLIFDTYISSLVTEVESAKMQLEAHAIGLEEKLVERTQLLEELSVTDELTRIFNQRHFFDQLRRELSTMSRVGQRLALVYLDLNGFKRLNDTRGHSAGNDVLVRVGAAMRGVCRAGDTPCRYGGDEFALIMPRSSIDDAKVLVARLIQSFKQSDNSGVSFAIGIAETGPGAFLDAETLVKKADAAMYQAKALSRQEPGYQVCEASRNDMTIERGEDRAEGTREVDTPEAGTPQDRPKLDVVVTG